MTDDQVSSLEYVVAVVNGKPIMPNKIYQELLEGTINLGKLSQALSNTIEEMEVDKEKRERFIPEVVMFT